VWREYFNRRAAEYAGSIEASDYFSAKSFLDQRRSILAWLGPLEGRSILDAGCGVGAFSEVLAERNRVCGVDFSETALKYASARGLRAACADLARLPFAPGTFDLVVCIGVLQLVADERAVLAELASMLAPGGTLVVQTLNRDSLQRKLRAPFAREPSFRLFRCAELRDAFHELGLGDVSFLNAHYPLRATTRSPDPGLLVRSLATSFAIRGRRPD
jgi:2-polyprenyl-3-methyl-5-hydroxy-6-metoxy-1,4-benzoquinol methylase